MSTYPLSLPKGRDNSLGTLTHPNASLWVLEMHNGADNRMTEEFIDDVLGASLDIVEADWRASKGVSTKGEGAFIITGKQDQDKFFSNGLDYEAVLQSMGRFFPHTFNPFLARFLSFPIPTIAAINGHAFAGGFLLSLACDYRVMTSGKAWCSMNEVHFGAPLPPPFARLLTTKLPTPQLIRKCTLEGHRFTSKELFESGIVDALADGGTKGVMQKATEVAARSAPLAKGGSWGLIKRELYRDILDLCAQDPRQIMPDEEADLFAKSQAAKAKL